MSGITVDARIKREWGARIRTLREKAQLTRVALGEMVGVSPKTLQSWEDGRSFPDDLSVLWSLGKALGNDTVAMLSMSLESICSSR